MNVIRHKNQQPAIPVVDFGIVARCVDYFCSIGIHGKLVQASWVAVYGDEEGVRIRNPVRWGVVEPFAFRELVTHLTKILTMVGSHGNMYVNGASGRARRSCPTC